MTKRILFVDDQPLVSQGLQRMLRPMRGVWDMVFVESGAEALAMMGEAPFDVVVSDARMPNMNGAELLAEVRRLHPATIRMILSGHGDRELVAECVGVAHQYISKPCDPEQLKSQIQDACCLSDTLPSEALRRTIGTLANLPVVPAIFHETKAALDQDDTNLGSLGGILQRDMAMTAGVLKVVNSAFFGKRRTISTVQEAVAFLELDTIKMLVLGNQIFEPSGRLSTQSITIEDIWRHSMAVAVGASAIATLETPDKQIQEEAFVGGILHDVGILILAAHCSDAFDQVAMLVREKGLALTDAERETFGVTHAEVGAYLLGLWGLPSGVRKIVSLHHHPATVGGGGFSPLLAVHAADHLVGLAGTHPIFAHGRLDHQALERAGLAERLERWQGLVLDPSLGLEQA